MTIPCLNHSNGGPSICAGCALPTRPVEKNGERQIIPTTSLLPPSLPPTPRRSARTSIVPDCSEKGECSGSPSPGSSKRKRGDSDSTSPQAAKVRRISDSTNGSLVAGSSKSLEVKPDRKCKKSKGRKGVKAHPKKALWFKLNEGYWYSAWPVAESADARACSVPRNRKPRDTTPMGLEKFDMNSIFGTPIFSKACKFPGMEDLRNVYAEVTSAPAASSCSMWNDGVANLVFLACELFLPKQIFKYEVTDSETGKEVEHKGPLTFYGAPLDRNYLIAAIISLSTGIFFTNKQVSSHQQHTLHKLSEKHTPTSKCKNSPAKKKMMNCSPKEREAEKKRLWEIIQLCKHGSPIAHESMSDYIDEIAQLRKTAVKGKGKDAKHGIPLSLHPLLAFFISRNGSFAPGMVRPQNCLVDVSDNKTHHLPWPFAWGWYFFCKAESVPEGEVKRSYPFGRSESPLDNCQYYSLSDIERSGNPSDQEQGSPEGESG